MEYPIQEKLDKDYQKKKEELAIKRLERYKIDPENKRKRLAYNLEWKIKNPEKVKLQRQKYWQKYGKEVVRKQREWSKANPERVKAYRDTYKAKLKKAVYDYYKRICNCCREIEEKFLTIDHVNNDGYKERIHEKGRRPSGTRTYENIIKSNFPDTYQVLCMNCNFGKARNNGVCPHRSEFYI